MAVRQGGEAPTGQDRARQCSGVNPCLSFQGPGCLLPLQIPSSVHDSLLLGSVCPLGHHSPVPLLPKQPQAQVVTSSNASAWVSLLAPAQLAAGFMFGEAERNLSMFTGKESSR